jgi:hypothetical protein
MHIGFIRHLTRLKINLCYEGKTTISIGILSIGASNRDAIASDYDPILALVEPRSAVNSHPIWAEGQKYLDNIVGRQGTAMYTLVVRNNIVKP